jgi:hypothetical protein
MALLQNITIWAQCPYRRSGGTLTQSADGNNVRPMLGINNTTMLAPAAGGFANNRSFPTGWQYGNGWLPPMKAETVWAANIGPGSSSITVTPSSLNLAEGRNIAGDITFAITLPDADLQLIVSATGTTTITFTESGLAAGALAAEGEASFAFTLPNATLGAIINAIATGAITFSGAGTPSAIGHLAGDITPFTELSPENLAANVWATIIESGYTAKQVMQLVGAHASGTTDINDLGGGNAEVTFNGLDDTTARIFAEMTGSERTTVTRTVD